MTPKARTIVIAAATVIALVVVLVLMLRTGWFSPDTKAATRTVLNPTAALSFESRLQFLWGKYMEMVQLTITLITGILILSAGLVKLGKAEAIAARGYYSAGMAALVIGLVCAVLWRIDAQLLMEIEIFGSREDTAAMFKATGVAHPFTSSFMYEDYIVLFGRTANALMAGAAIGFLSGIGSLAMFTLKNLPATSRTASAFRSPRSM